MTVDECKNIIRQNDYYARCKKVFDTCQIHKDSSMGIVYDPETFTPVPVVGYIVMFGLYRIASCITYKGSRNVVHFSKWLLSAQNIDIYGDLEFDAMCDVLSSLSLINGWLHTDYQYIEGSINKTKISWS